MVIVEWERWLDLLAPAPPWAHLVVADEREAERVLRWQAPRDVGIVARSIRGERCETKAACLNEWGAALQFPYYFGKNWDAFNDCITDLEWLPARSYLLIVTRADQLLHDDVEFAVFARMLDQTAMRWAGEPAVGGQLWRLPASFHVVFQCDATHEGNVRDRFRAVNIALDTLVLPNPPS